MNDDLDLMGGAIPPVDNEELEKDNDLEEEELEEDDEEIEKVKPASGEDGDVSLEDLGEEEVEKSNMNAVDDEGNPQF